MYWLKYAKDIIGRSKTCERNKVGFHTVIPGNVIGKKIETNRSVGLL